MTALVIADVIVAVGLGVVAVVCLRIVNRHARESATIEAELESTRQRLRTAESILAAAATAPVSVETDGGEGGRDTSREVAAPAESGIEAEAVAGSADRHVLHALWRLACLDVELERSRAAGLSTAALDAGPVGLAQAVEQEIARIREEIGTPGVFQSDLDREPDPAGALLLLGSAQSTLDFVARRCQAFDLHLYRQAQEGRLAVTVVCDDFDTDPPAGEARSGAHLAGFAGGASGSATTSGRATGTGVEAAAGGVATSMTVPEAAAIVRAIEAAGGRLVFDRQSDGRIRAQLSVPVR